MTVLILLPAKCSQVTKCRTIRLNPNACLRFAPLNRNGEPGVTHPRIAEDSAGRNRISVGQAFQPDSSGSQAGKPDLHRHVLMIVLRLHRRRSLFQRQCVNACHRGSSVDNPTFDRSMPISPAPSCISLLSFKLRHGLQL